jgi:putative colanic acid biosynthesis acetyltransferase WcaF
VLTVKAPKPSALKVENGASIGLLDVIAEPGESALRVTRQAQDAYRAEVLAAMAGKVGLAYCNSYFRHPSGNTFGASAVFGVMFAERSRISASSTSSCAGSLLVRSPKSAVGAILRTLVSMQLACRGYLIVTIESVKPGDRFSLREFTGAGYDTCRPRIVLLLWIMASHWLTMHWWCPNRLRVRVLRAFGAKIGDGVSIPYNVKIHWPWKLQIGDHSWLGEESWILNLEPVTIGANTCISQQAFLCTGSHDRHSRTFEFDNAPITVGDSVWVATRATVLRGVNVGDGATIGAGALVVKDVPVGATVLAPLSI